MESCLCSIHTTSSYLNGIKKPHPLAYVCIDIKIRRYGIVAIEPTRFQRPNDTEVRDYQ